MPYMSALYAAAQLEFLPAAHEVVIGRIEREQHADSALRIGVQDHEVAVLRPPRAPAVDARSPAVVVGRSEDGLPSVDRVDAQDQGVRSPLIVDPHARGHGARLRST